MGTRGSFLSLLLMTTALTLAGGGPAAGQEARTAEETEEERLGEDRDDLRLGAVVVEGDAVWEASGLAPAATISAQEIERRNPQNLQQIFETTPSVTVASGGPANQRLFVNGIDQSKVAIQIDGARQQNTVWHHNGDFGISPFFLKSLEVEEGVAPADAGFAALAGAIQAETKDVGDLLLPGQSLGGTLIGEYETNSNTYRVTTAAYGEAKGWELMGIFDRADGSDYKDGDGDTQTGTEENLYSGLAKLGYESQSGHRIVASGEYYYDKADRRLRPNLYLPSQPFLNENTAKRLTATVTYTNSKPSDLFNPDITLYYNRNVLERPNDNDYTRPSGDFNSYNDEIGGKAENVFSFDFGTVTAGADFFNTHVTVDRFHFDDSVSESIFDVGFYTQARVEPIEDLLVSTGLRVDVQSYHSVDDKRFNSVGASPNISAAYNLFEGFWVNAGYSYVFGGINQSEAALFHARDYAYSDDLKPSYAHNVKAGATYAIAGLSLGGNWFYTKMTNVEAYDYAASPSLRVNGEDLISKGYNVFARYDWPTAFVSGAFNHTDLEYDGRTATPSDTNTANAVGDILALEAGVALPDYGVTFGSSAEIAFDFEDQDLLDAGFSALEDYQAWNLYATWAPVPLAPHLVLRFDVRNLLDQQYVPRGSFYALAPRGIEPVYAPGRSFLVSTTLQF